MALYGTRTLIRVTFTDPLTGEAFDPAGVKLILKMPNAESVSFLYGPGGGDIVRDDVGKFHFSLLLTVVGVVAYRWESLAAGEESAVESSFTVTVPTVT